MIRDSKIHSLFWQMKLARWKSGQIMPEGSLRRWDYQRKIGNSFAYRVEKIASEVRRQFGMRTIFHNHCGSFVETPKEIARLLELTDPSLLGLCLDIGHYAFGGGDPVEGIKEYYDRIWHIHFKDLNPRIDEEAAKNNYDYFKSVEEGVFCELGKEMWISNPLFAF